MRHPAFCTSSQTRPTGHRYGVGLYANRRVRCRSTSTFFHLHPTFLCLRIRIHVRSIAYTLPSASVCPVYAKVSVLRSIRLSRILDMNVAIGKSLFLHSHTVQYDLSLRQYLHFTKVVGLTFSLTRREIILNCMRM